MKFKKQLSSILMSSIALSSLMPLNSSAKLTSAYEHGKNKVIRGPYLQIPTSTSIHVRWRTEHPTASLIEYGTQKNKLNQSQSLALLTTEHDLTLRGLKPNTKYYYAIYEYRKDKKKLLIGNGEKYYFITAPSAESKLNTRIWVLGSQGSLERAQKKTKKAYLKHNQDQETNLILTLGNNAFDHGTDEQYQKAFFEFYEDILARVPFYTCFGEKDGGMIEDLRGATAISFPEAQGVYFDNFTLPAFAEAGGLGSKTEAYYSFNYANTHFVVLDSYDSHWDSRMVDWLNADLATTEQDWTIVLMHHPAYSARIRYHDPSSKQSKWVKENIVPVLEAHNVDLVISGQINKYERTEQVKNGKNTSPQNPLKAKAIYMQGNGPIHVVMGSSGTLAEDLHEEGRADYNLLSKSIYENGSLVLDISPINLSVSFLNSKAKISDHFDIIKVGK